MTVPVAEVNWVIDTHVHMWDRNRPELTYDWLDPLNPHSVLTPAEVRQLGTPLEDGVMLARLCAPAAVPAVVHVQAAVGIADPVCETQWLEQERKATGFPQSIVGSADLASPDIEEVLDRHLVASPAFIGVRDFGKGTEYLDDPAWGRGIDALAARGLVACLDVSMERMPLMAALAREHPQAMLILDHMGMPERRGSDTIREWVLGASALAALPNVFCKVSEQTMVLHRWDRANAIEWMRACIDTFGPARCFFGSNWPVDSLYVSYVELVDTYREVASEHGADDSAALRWRNACQVYAIDSNAWRSAD